MKTHDGPHGGVNHNDDCYGCRLKAKNLTLASSATPTRGRRQPFRPMVQPSWESGGTGETRRDGSFMPYLDESLQPIGVKEMADDRTRLEAIRHKQLHDPNFGKETQ
jgi:hypothetical protein